MIKLMILNKFQKKVLKRNKVVVGFMERMEEFLVQMKHRVGWKDMRSILTSSLSSNAALKVSIPKELLSMMQDQEYLTTEMSFHSSVRLLYLDQVGTLLN